jgi:DNA polymerase III epsilon subunit-like protein
MIKVCVFDTETSGLPGYLPGKDWKERNENDEKLLNYSDLNNSSSTSMWNKMLPSWPSIIQLSYIIYDTENPPVSKIYNKFIELTDEVKISEGSIAIHKIDKNKINEMPSEKKAPVEVALSEFLNDIMNPEVTIVVGHNVQFDRKMIIAELLRLQNTANSDLTDQIKYLMTGENFACTMSDTADFCNIQIPVNYIDKRTGAEKVFYKIKSPKLSESYQHYFGYAPMGDALHDALVDVVVCLRVFMKYKFQEDICGKNKEITDYIINISPDGYVCPMDITNKMSEIPYENIIDSGLDISQLSLENIDDNTNANKKAGGGTKKSKRKGKKNKKNKKKTKRTKK